MGILFRTPLPAHSIPGRFPLTLRGVRDVKVGICRLPFFVAQCRAYEYAVADHLSGSAQDRVFGPGSDRDGGAFGDASSWGCGAERVAACCCGQQARYRELRSKAVLTAVGSARVSRPYYLCPNRHAGQFPADVELDIENTEFSPGVCRMQAMVGQEAPFDHGRQQMKLLAGLEEIQRAVQPDLPIMVGERIPILYVQMDGTGVPVGKKETVGVRARRKDNRHTHVWTSPATCPARCSSTSVTFGCRPSEMRSTLSERSMKRARVALTRKRPRARRIAQQCPRMRRSLKESPYSRMYLAPQSLGEENVSR